ncbi:hypothetical protein ACY2DA_00705 [Staphylococcus simulans]
MGEKLVTRMDNKEAKRFFLKSESYFNSELPSYINIDGFLKQYEKIVKNTLDIDGKKIKKLNQQIPE